MKVETKTQKKLSDCQGNKLIKRGSKPQSLSSYPSCCVLLYEMKLKDSTETTNTTSV